MKVNFKGLYVIPGSDSRANGKDDMQSVSTKKLQNFLEDTKPFRSMSGYSFYDYKTGDYYMAVSDKYDYAFEFTADEYNINYRKVGSKLVRNSAPAQDEIQKLGQAMTDAYKMKINAERKK